MLRDVTLLLVPWLQGMCLLWALVCSLTRITDHRHHWWDVLAGSLVGVVSAVYTVSLLFPRTVHLGLRLATMRCIIFICPAGAKTPQFTMKNYHHGPHSKRNTF